MDAKVVEFDLMDELLAIRKGLCMWCATHQPHPAYSRCAHRECSGDKQVVVVGASRLSWAAVSETEPTASQRGLQGVPL